MTFNLKAVDANQPPQPLVYQLVEGPEGFTVSPEGQVRWSPSESQGPSTHRITVRVSDGFVQVPHEFTVIVRDAITGTPGPTLGLVPRQDGSWNLSISGIGGARYQVEQVTALGASWAPVPGVAEVVTQGSNAPVVLVLPAQAATLRVFRLGRR